MVYSPAPPYEVLQTGAIDFETMARLRRLARYWDVVANSGNFRTTVERVSGVGYRVSGEDAKPQARPVANGAESAFAQFMDLSDWLHQRTGATHGIALARLTELLFEYLTGPCALEPATAAAVLASDYQRCGRSARDLPAVVRQALPEAPGDQVPPRQQTRRRQGRHL
jgi:hypothetical protein